MVWVQWAAHSQEGMTHLLGDLHHCDHHNFICWHTPGNIYKSAIQSPTEEVSSITSNKKRVWLAQQVPDVWSKEKNHSQRCSGSCIFQGSHTHTHTPRHTHSHLLNNIVEWNNVAFTLLTQEPPMPIPPSMFNTWPAKSELGHRKKAKSPTPPVGGAFQVNYIYADLSWSVACSLTPLVCWRWTWFQSQILILVLLHYVSLIFFRVRMRSWFPCGYNHNHVMALVYVHMHRGEI